MQHLLEHLTGEDLTSILPVLAAMSTVNNSMGGMANPLSGFGVRTDQSSYDILTASSSRITGIADREYLYCFGNPLIQHAVNIYPDFASLAEFTLEDPKLNDQIAMKDYIINIVSQMDKYRHLDGSSLTVNMNRYGGKGIKVLNPLNCEYLGNDQYLISSDQDCDENEDLLSNVVLSKGDYFKFDNIWMPNRLQEHNNNFGISTVDIITESLVDFIETKMSSKAIVKRHNVLTYGIEGFSKFLLAANKEKINELVKNMLMTVSVNNHLYHDSKNTPGFISQNLTGLPDIFDQFKSQIPSIIKCPGTIFWSSSQKGGGLGNTTEGDLKIWESYLNAYRKKNYIQPIRWLIGELYGFDNQKRNSIKLLLDPIILVENRKLEIDDYKAKTDRISKAKQCGAITSEEAKKLFFPEYFGELVGINK